MLAAIAKTVLDVSAGLRNVNTKIIGVNMSALKVDKEQIKKEILAWLDANGCPPYPDHKEFVIENLKLIFNHLLSKNLVLPKMYNAFCQSAFDKYLISEMI